MAKTKIGPWFGRGVVVWVLLVGLAGCGDEDSGAGTSGADAGVDQAALLSARVAMDDAAKALSEAERRVAHFDEVAAEYDRLSAELEAKQAEQALHQKTLRDLDKQYEGLVLPRTARRRSINAQGSLNTLQREIPLLREQLSAREPLIAQRAEAVAELDRARTAYADAEGALAIIER